MSVILTAHISEADNQIVLGYLPHLMNPNYSAEREDRISADSSSGSHHHQISTSKRQRKVPTHRRAQHLLTREEHHRRHSQAASLQGGSLQHLLCRCFPLECDLRRRRGVQLLMIHLRCQTLTVLRVLAVRRWRSIVLLCYLVSFCSLIKRQRMMASEKRP